MLKTPDRSVSLLPYPSGLLLCGALFVLGAKLGSTRRKARVAAYKGPAGGWGSAKAVTEALIRNRVPLRGARLLLHQNKSKGFACVSCAWAKPKSRALEFCENGAKATAWEIDAHRATPEFFANHTIDELLTMVRFSIGAPGTSDSSPSMGQSVRQIRTCPVGARPSAISDADSRLAIQNR